MEKESLNRSAEVLLGSLATAPLSPSPSLQINLFGGVSLRNGDGPIELPGLKNRALLAYLGMSLGEPVARSKLAALLWGDTPERQARDSLKQAVWHLRRAFGPAGEWAIRTDRQSLSLDPTFVAVDAVAFAQLLASADDEAMEQAMSLYRGEFLEGIEIRSPAFEDWLLVARQKIHRMASEALAAMLDRSLAAGRRSHAAMTAQRLLALEPLHEGACRALMRIHAERAQRNQALKLFETLRERLREELGIRPEAETAALYESIRGNAGSAKAAAEPAVVERLTPKPSIAVLPFVNIGNDPEQEYFASGLTEDIVTDLSQISGLLVFAHHGPVGGNERLSARETARAGNVGYLLEGSVRKSGNRIRVNAQLVDSETGAHVWASRYDRDMADVFALQDEIARGLAEVLRVKLLPGELESLAFRPTESADAYQFYLLGRSFYLRGINRGSLRVARDLFAKAREIDPLYARTYSGIAICDYYLSMSDVSVSFESMMANSTRAVELAPALGEAHAAKGLAHYCGGQYEEATAEFERAITLDPHLFEAHFFQARCCRLRGMHEEAARLFERAAELRPDDFRSIGLLSEEFGALGRLEESRSAAARCLRCVEGEVKAHPDNAGAWAFGSGFLAALGEHARAREWAMRAVIIGPDDYLVHYNVSRTYALLGEADVSLDWLERALTSLPVFRCRLIAWMSVDRNFDLVRDHPRYHAIWRKCATDR